MNITGLNRFFFVCNFHDMRCKYDKVLSIIHQQLNCEPEDGDDFDGTPQSLKSSLPQPGGAPAQEEDAETKSKSG